MTKNQIVSESNRSLLVETLRSITEILIWGDQNDSSVFEYEKNVQEEWTQNYIIYLHLASSWKKTC